MSFKGLMVLNMAILRVFLSRLLTVFIVFAMVLTSFVTAANARFISPDDWDPVVQGVGTNRYSYADNDPINNSDPNGNAYGSQKDTTLGTINVGAKETRPRADTMGRGDGNGGDGFGRGYGSQIPAITNVPIMNHHSNTVFGSDWSEQTEVAVNGLIVLLVKKLFRRAPKTEPPAPTSKILLFTENQLKSKYMKHSTDFGFTQNYNKMQGVEFSKTINSFINRSDTITRAGTYKQGRIAVIHHTNPTSGVNVMSDPAGNFISGWRLNQQQLKNVLTRGSL